MARLRFVRKKQQPWGRLTTALGVFLILCGLILLLAGRGVSCGIAQQQNVVTRTRIALKQARRAELALQRSNFGVALSAVQGVQEDLKRVLAALNAAEAEREE